MKQINVNRVTFLQILIAVTCPANMKVFVVLSIFFVTLALVAAVPEGK